MESNRIVWAETSKTTELAKRAAQQGFEEWASNEGLILDKCRNPKCTETSVHYDAWATIKAWKAWQAALDSAGVWELTAKLEAEIENRKGWQNRAADAEAKIYYSETPCEAESPDPPINLRELTEQYRKNREANVALAREVEKLREQVRELTEALEQTLVIARQALVYFNTESGRAAMKELEKIEARIKGEKLP